MTTPVERPVGGPVLTSSVKAALALAAAAVAYTGVRLVAGLGSTTALSDGYPWGVWKPLNVATFTGIGAGALSLSLLVHVANRGRYHPLLRSAVLAGAISYALAALSLLVELGRWWNVRALLAPTLWNLESVLLEVVLSSVACAAVLCVEALPHALERPGRPGSRLRRWARRRFPVVVALAIVLPLMQQSSLGSIFLVAPTKLHPLWHSPLLPVLFVLSCLSMGIAAVIVLDTVTHLAWRRTRDVSLDAALSLVMAATSLAFVALRVAEVAWAGELETVHGPKGLLFVVELALFAYPSLRVLAPSYRCNPGYVFWAAQLALAAGALYRFDTYLAAFDPGDGWGYFPSLGELLFSAGLAAAGAAAYVAAVKRLPVLSGVAGRAASRVGRRSAA